jgi:hypothetical protein
VRVPAWLTGARFCRGWCAVCGWAPQFAPGHDLAASWPDGFRRE